MGAPWFKFFPREYLTDSKVKMLSRDHRSILLDLWCYCAVDGSIPADPEAISRLIGESQAATKKAMEKLSAFFVERDGVLISERLNAEAEAYEEKCLRLRANGTKGGRPRKPNGLPDGFEDETNSGNQLLNQKGPEAEAEAEAEAEKDYPLPPAASPSGEVKVVRKPSWQKAHSPEVIEATKAIKAIWPTPGADQFQPDMKTLVPGVSSSELACRLADIQGQGADLSVCVQIAARAVAEWQAGKWIKAPQHFFGKAKDAPFRAYYQAHITNQALREVS